jgi:hypothetical protein
MPHIPDIHAHADHDLELIAAYASGDTTGADLDTASALVAGCAECSALHHDLRAIAAALPAMPAPVRRRDFRLTPGQAAALRPAGWRRLAGWLAGPRFAFAAPLGAGLATLGLAVLLVTGPGLSIGLGGAASADRMSNGAADTTGVAAPEMASHAASPEPQFGAAIKSSPAPSAVDGRGSVTQPQVAATAAPGSVPVTTADTGTGGLSPAALAAALALVVGLVLAAGRILARRLARAP